MEYTSKDIVSLSAGRAFREKLGMYLTGEKQEAINLGLRELIVNVQDEYEVYQPKNAYCKIILDTKKRIIQCSDNARGIPCGTREDGINSLTAAFLIPHSGGKHTEGAYSSAIGINGEGNKIVCHTAKWLEVEVKRDGNIYFQRFESDEEGAKALENVKIIGKTKETGTKITYVADPLVYGDIFIDIPKLEEMLKNMSLFSKGLKFILIVNGKEKTFYSENGLIDGLSNQNALSKPFSFFYKTDDCQVELALQWVVKKGEIRGYANSLYVKDGGPFISLFKSSLTRTFNSLAKEKFDGERIRALLDGFVSVKVRVGQWSNQQKTSLANPEAGTATSAAISQCLKEFATNRKEDFQKVVELLQKIERAEKAADAVRTKILSAEKEINEMRTKKGIILDKVSDAKILGESSRLLVCEGRSASGSAKKGRDKDYHGIFEARGKMINGFSCSEEKFLDNEEIKQLQAAVGFDYGKPFNPKKLRYGYIDFFVDPDVDGAHIFLLGLVDIWKICPEFIKQGRVGWYHAPLFIVEYKGKKTYFYTDEDYNERGRKLPGEVRRVKGLGLLEKDELREAIFNCPEAHETFEYTPEAIEALEALMGADVQPKKDFVFSNIDFSEYGEM